MSLVMNGTSCEKVIANGDAMTEVFSNGTQVIKERWSLINSPAATAYDPGTDGAVDSPTAIFLQDSSNARTLIAPSGYRKTEFSIVGQGPDFIAEYLMVEATASSRLWLKVDAGGGHVGGIRALGNNNGGIVTTDNLAILVFTYIDPDFAGTLVESAWREYSAETGLLVGAAGTEYVVSGSQGVQLTVESTRFKVDWFWNGTLTNAGNWVDVARVNNV